jgi:hypothetical protein
VVALSCIFLILPVFLDYDLLVLLLEHGPAVELKPFCLRHLPSIDESSVPIQFENVNGLSSVFEEGVGWSVVEERILILLVLYCLV